jgi:NADP-dependent 3-hydroxy acid dehydrogenase YdfG
MVRGGARHFVFLSRSGAKKTEAQETIKALQDDGAHVAAFACDIADEESLRQALEAIRQQFPPIKGLLQCAMVLNDALYENMTHQEYMNATRPKVQGSWNLHTLLPQDLDFFVLLSSSAGVAGSRGQGNYAAGNTYEDALANYRNSKGQHATSIDLGMILDVGYVAETSNQEVAENTKKWTFAGIREEELHLIIQCGITQTSVRGRKVPAQLITGLGTGGMAKLAGYEIPWWFSDAKFAHIKNVDTSKVQSDGTEDNEETLALLPQATSMENAADIVQIALTKKLAKSLMVEVEDIDSAKPISRHGVDSLLAVEVRAWLVTDLKADISVFQLLSNVPISELVRDIAAKSKLVPASVSGGAATS